MVNKLTNNVPASARSVIRQLADVLPEIEDGLLRGYSHAVMHAALPALGINVSLPYYYKMLHKLRQERRDKALSPEATQPAVPHSTAPIAGHTDVTKATVLSTAIDEIAAGELCTIPVAPSATQPFRWKAKDFLSKDWSNF